MKKALGKTFTVLFFISAYAFVWAGIVYVLHISGKYPSGDDTMYHIYRAEFLIENFKIGNYFPLYNRYMYNGVQLFRYFAPASAYLIALFQMLGSMYFPEEVFIGYELYTGFLYFVGACGFLWAGIRRDRVLSGGFLGLIWFFVPNAMMNYFGAGNMAMGFCLAFTPYLYSAVFEWIDTKNVRMIKWIVIFSALVILGHLGFGSMVALALLLYLIVFKIINHRSVKFSIITIVILILTGAMVIGIIVLPGAVGGMASAGNASLAISNFQELSTTLDPLARLSTGGRTNYFGLASALFCLFAILFCHRKEKAFFISAIIILLGSSVSAYPLISSIPGGRFMWMLRFLTLAVCLSYFGFLYWRSLRPWIAIVFAILLVVDIIPSIALIYRGESSAAPIDGINAFAEEAMLDKAKEITRQRVAVLDEASLGATAPYYLASGERPVMQSYGAGFEAAYTRINITRINEAIDSGEYTHAFDRCLELGNDTVLLRISILRNGEHDVEKAISAAKSVGYELKDSNNGYLLFSLDTDAECFGVKTEYEHFGIGTSIGDTTMFYPNMQESDTPYLDDYTFEDLAAYHTILLDHFFYHDKDAAEKLVKDLSDSGVRIVIASDGIPVNEKIQMQEFMGVQSSSISFENGYPLLYMGEEVYDTDLFNELYQNWRTTFLNGLDDVWGYFFDESLEMPFIGTIYNENVVVVGLNLFYHYLSTQDPATKAIIEKAMDASMYDPPERTIVPITVDYGTDRIIITSEEDMVNTTIAFQDNFSVTGDTKYDTEDRLLRVNKGTTEVMIGYPLKRQGVILMVFGFCLWMIMYVILYEKYAFQYKDFKKQGKEHSSD
ncbi:MAG: hypothetical protein K6A69_02655 [Lachnospiraceae bacterium]|nr:hypothetical protein [Lachnospiraceae bacterium]